MKESAEQLEDHIVEMSYWLSKRRFRARDTDNLAPREVCILEMLGRCNALSFSSIADCFANTANSTISATIGEMVEKKFIKRMPNDSDQRAKTLSITKEGRDELVAARKRLHDRMAAMFAMINLTDDERKCCDEVVRRANEQFSLSEKI